MQIFKQTLDKGVHKTTQVKVFLLTPYNYCKVFFHR